MKKKSPVILSVQNPCTSSWEDMSVLEGGKFCQNCQKQVIDFSGMSDQELITFVRKTAKPFCGRYTYDQLDRELVGTAVRGKSFLPGVMLSSFIAAIIPVVKAVAANPQVEVYRDTIFRDSERKQSGDTAGIYINGSVADFQTNDCITWATIKIKGTTYHTSTDAEGNFRILIPADIETKNLSLIVSTIGYMTMEINPQRNQQGMYLPVNLQMKSTVTGLDETVVVLNRWQVFKYKTRNWFKRVF